MQKISVIIPTLNAEKYIDNLLKKLESQSLRADEIIIIDSESTDSTIQLCEKYDNVKVVEIKRNDFDHGGTRDYALRQSIGDFVLFLTQDAIPYDDYYIENLVAPFVDANIVMTTGRQVARNDAGIIEILTREFNYPVDSHIRDHNDIKQMGIKTFFVSNVCSAYRKSAYYEMGGFKNPIIISEDMIIASDFIYTGNKIAYVAEAKVIHSHNYSLKQQFMRNFDTGVVMKIYEDKFLGISVQAEGVRMVKTILMELFKRGRYDQVVYYCIECAAKLFGNKLGGRYEKLTQNMIMKCTMNKMFWIKKYAGNSAEI